MKYGKYRSSTILLEQQSSEFAVRKSMSIRGEVRIETGNRKGAVRAIIQNLMPPERSGKSYVLCFFGRSGDGAIHTKLGNLVLNRFGNGETYFRFNPCNVDGCGHELGEFLYVVVAAAPAKNSSEPLKPVLTGTIHGAEILGENGVKPRRTDASTPSDAAVENSDCPVETAVGKSSGGRLTVESAEADLCSSTAAECSKGGRGTGESRDGRGTEMGGGAEQQQKNVNQTPWDNGQSTLDCAEGSSPVDSGSDTAEESNSGRLAGEPGGGTAAAGDTKPVTYNCYYNRLVMQKCEKLYIVMRKNHDLWQNRVNPFRPDKLKAEWYKIDNYRLLPMISPGGEEACMKYKHFIFGLGEKCYYIGIPGRFMKEDQPESGQSGFTYWQPIAMVPASAQQPQSPQSIQSNQSASPMKPLRPAQNEPPSQPAGSYGYWITAIDIESGDIIDAGLAMPK